MTFLDAFLGGASYPAGVGTTSSIRCTPGCHRAPLRDHLLDADMRGHAGRLDVVLAGRSKVGMAELVGRSIRRAPNTATSDRFRRRAVAAASTV
jgi:hypothetical protein